MHPEGRITAGTVNGGGSYRPAQTVELEAEPNSGWRFAGWHSRYWQDNSRETSVDIYRDMTIEARFVEIEGEGE